MNQTTLTQDGKMILDSTCSFSKIWPKHATVRIDVRPECNPDIVMSATDLKFPDKHFDEIYCDPPHMFRRGKDLTKIKINRRLSGRRSPGMFERYGFWATKEEWFDFIDKTNKEFSRVLKSDGLLYYKITEASGCTKPSDLIERMTNFVVVEDLFDKVKSNLGKGNTHYITFKHRFTEIDSDTWDGA